MDEEKALNDLKQDDSANASESIETASVSAEAAVEAEPAPKPKRKRRTKAEIEAEAKKAAAKAKRDAKKAAEKAAEKAVEDAVEGGAKAVERISRARIPAPEIVVQYSGTEVETAALTDAAVAQFRAAKKRAGIKEIKLYVKPEDRAAYFVINGDFSGKVDF